MSDAVARTRLGLWLMIPDPIVVEAAGRAGADWVGLDLQHGTWDLGTVFRGIQLLDALGMPALIRVSELELSLIPRVLDHGASGIVIAMATGPDMVAGAVSLARYAPDGTRSYGGQRYGMRPEPPDVAEVRPGIYPMIEDARGARSVAEIARVPGVAGLHVGPVDLGLGMGLGMDRSAPRFSAALDDIVAAGHTGGIPVTQWLARGFDEIVLPADVELLRGAFAREIRDARRDPAASQIGTYGRPA
jgi:4-hydroxy-2-oxoheptanedioate aldolase